MRMYLVQSQYLPGSVWQLDPPGSGQPGTSLYPMMCLLQQYAVNWPSAVHRVGEPPRFADVALVLYPDAPCIVGPVAGVPGYVRLVHRPPYLAVRGANRVVRGDVYEGAANQFMALDHDPWVAWTTTLFMALEPVRLALV